MIAGQINVCPPLQNGRDTAGIVLVKNEGVTRHVLLELRYEKVIEARFTGSGRTHNKRMGKICLVEVEVVGN